MEDMLDNLMETLRSKEDYISMIPLLNRVKSTYSNAEFYINMCNRVLGKDENLYYKDITKIIDKTLISDMKKKYQSLQDEELRKVNNIAHILINNPVFCKTIGINYKNQSLLQNLVVNYSACVQRDIDVKK